MRLSGFVLVVVNVMNQNESTQAPELVCGNHHLKTDISSMFFLDPEGAQAELLLPDFYAFNNNVSSQFSRDNPGRTSSVSSQDPPYHAAAILT